MHNKSVAGYCLLLRVIASHFVLIGHAASYFQVLQFTQWPRMPYIQSISVIVFFFLSGFTIAWLCDARKAESNYSYEKFLLDRFCRIFIPFIPVLIIFAIFETFVYGKVPHPYPDSFTLETFFANILMLLSYPFTYPPFGTNRPLWSIASEWWLYISYGMITLGVSSKCLSIRTLLFALFALSLAITLSDLTGIGKNLGFIWLIGAGTWMIIRTDQWKIISPAIYQILLVASLSLLFVPHIWPDGGTYSLIWNLLISVSLTLSVFVVSRLSSKILSGAASNRSLNFMGRYSYTLYLSHYPILEFMFRSNYFLSKPWSGFIFGCVLSLAIAIFLAYAFEFRYKWYRDRLARILFPTIPKLAR